MADPLFNVDWNMHKGLSVFSVGGPPPDTETRRYEPVGSGYKLTVSGTRQGIPYSWNYTAQYDGKDHPVNGRADADAIEAYKINDRITVGFFKKGADLAGPYARMVSADGNTLTVQAAGRDSAGKPYFDVIVYNK